MISSTPSKFSTKLACLKILHTVAQILSDAISHNFAFFNKSSRRASTATVTHFLRWYVHLNYKRIQSQGKVEALQRKVEDLGEKLSNAEEQRDDFWLKLQDMEDSLEEATLQRDEVVDQREAEMGEVKELRMELQAAKTEGYLKDGEIMFLRAWVRLLPLPWTGGDGHGSDARDDSPVEDMD